MHVPVHAQASPKYAELPYRCKESNIREITQDLPRACADFCFQANSLAALQEACETYLAGFLKTAQGMASGAHRAARGTFNFEPAAFSTNADFFSTETLT